MAKEKKFGFSDKYFFPSQNGQYFYDYVNKKYFKYRLPNVLVGFYYDKEAEDEEHGSCLKFHGAKFPHYILLNPHFQDCGKIIEMTILHEAIHVSLNNKHNHGPKFQKERRRLIVVGAFDELL